MGLLLVLVGGLMMAFGRFHLPGDIVYRRDGFTLFAPLGTSLLISIVLTLLLNLLLRGR